MDEHLLSLNERREGVARGGGSIAIPLGLPLVCLSVCLSVCHKTEFYQNGYM